MTQIPEDRGQGLLFSPRARYPDGPARGETPGSWRVRSRFVPREEIRVEIFAISKQRRAVAPLLSFDCLDARNAVACGVTHNGHGGGSVVR